MAEVIVFKFGGSILDSSEHIEKAAQRVKAIYSKGFGVIVVVSALRGVTDSLISTARKANPHITPEMLDEVASMGERTSARLFASALQGVGLDAVVVDPDSPYWPILTDSNHLDANPLYEETKHLVEERLKPLLDAGKVPVVCGFVGKTVDGKVTTLGRGGSDTTAVLLGSILRAKEVVLVKDVGKVFSSDPDKVSDAVPITSLDSEEALALSVGGAKFLHYKALRYKVDGVPIHIASLDPEDKGTVIDGESLLNVDIEALEDPVTMITVVGNMNGSHKAIGELLANVYSVGGKVISLGSEPKSIVLYVLNGSKVLGHLHSWVVSTGFGKAVSSYDNLTMITVKAPAMETSPGMVQRVTQPLARHGINVFGLVTAGSSIRIFISLADRDKALALLREALMVSGSKR
ncbi:MAG: ACT domain-containing protein [Nitrososphaerales archaeon]